MSVAYLLLGSNLGDKATILLLATESLRKLSKKPLITSSMYESEPWGFVADEWFLNMAVRLETDLVPDDLLGEILKIEKDLGRVRKKEYQGYESRAIDIDILLYDSIVVNRKKLVIPHPRIQLRRFMLLPLCEIDPKLIHPALNKSIEKLLQECPDKLRVRIIK